MTALLTLTFLVLICAICYAVIVIAIDLSRLIDNVNKLTNIHKDTIGTLENLLVKCVCIKDDLQHIGISVDMINHSLNKDSDYDIDKLDDDVVYIIDNKTKDKGDNSQSPVGED